MFENLNLFMHNLNTSKYFAGIMMLLLNLGSRFLVRELSETQEQFLNNTIIRRFIIFTIVFIATRDVWVAFILTSIFEGSPNVLIEAQYLKKYIISTDCPTGPREILQNGKFGELVKMGDYKNIAKRLENFSYNAAVKKKVILGFNNIKNYDQKKNCMKYYNLINEYLI